MRADLLTDRMLSISATIVAVAALATSVYEARITREQQKNAVWPYLSHYGTDSAGHALRVQNVGLGPALIGWFRVRVDDRPVRTWGEALTALGPGYTGAGSTYSSLTDGSVITPTAVVNVLQLTDTGDVRRLRAAAARLVTATCYCSLYGECWESSSVLLRPAPVAECRADAALDFRQ